MALLSVGATACGSSVSLGDDVAGSTTTSTASSSATAATSGSGSAQGGGGQGGQTTGRGGGGAGAGGEGGDTGPSAGPWRADMWIGQVDHLSIRHHATDSDVCILINATAPASPAYDVMMEEPWAVNHITAWQDASTCMDEAFTPVEPSQEVATAVGSIDFEVPSGQVYPCELDVAVAVTFDQPPVWLDDSYALEATMVVVNGACP